MKKLCFWVLCLFLIGCGDGVDDTGLESGDIQNKDMVEVEGKSDLVSKKEADEVSIRLTEYFDYSCPHCQRMQGALRDLKEVYGDQIVIESIPLLVYEGSRGAMLAAECARDQGKWKLFHDALFNLKGEFDERILPGLAQDLELDQSQFVECIALGDKHAVLEQYKEKAKQKGISATPTFVINNKTFVTGGYPASVFKKMIENIIKK